MAVGATSWVQSLGVVVDLPLLLLAVVLLQTVDQRVLATVGPAETAAFLPILLLLVVGSVGILLLVVRAVLLHAMLALLDCLVVVLLLQSLLGCVVVAVLVV